MRALISMFLSIVVFVAPTLVAAEGECERHARKNECVAPIAEVSTGKVSLKGSSGSKGSAPKKKTNATGGAADIHTPTEPPIPPGGVLDLPSTDRRSPFYNPRDTYSVIRALNAADVAEFLVNDAQARMEPDGWALVGEPARFFAQASAHTVSATLLDRPAEVRFVPAEKVWDYGDSTAARRAAREPAGQHTYRSAGTYTATLTVSYSAEYRHDGDTGWTEVIGLVPGHPVTIPITVHNAKARLIKNR